MSDDWGDEPLEAPPSAKGLALNNPLNLRPLSKGRWPGQTGVSNGFAVFDTLDDGWAAADQNLQAKVKKHGLKNLSAIIGDPHEGWAPAKDNNDPMAYAGKVAAETGIKADQDIGSKLLTDAAFRKKVLHGMASVETGIDDTSAWGNDPVEGGSKSAPAKPTPLQQARAKPKEDFLSPLAHIPSDIAHQYGEAARSTNENIASFFKPQEKGDPGAVARTMQIGANTLAAAMSPITGTAEALVGRPVANLANATGIPQRFGLEADPEAIGNLATMAAGGAGEVSEANALSRASKAAGVSERTLAANRAAAGSLPKTNGLKAAVEPKNEHQAAVARLEAQGVHPAAHQAAGGLPQRIAESAKSDPYVGEGIRQAEAAANDSFNRALYNKVLKPIGISVDERAPVDRNSIGKIQDKLSQAYDEVLPHVRVMDDKQLTDNLAEIRTSVAKLGKPQEQQFEAILNQDVLHHFGKGGMDGKTFKTVESDILRQSRNLKGSPDPNARGLGHALDDVLDVLRENMVDHSPAEYRAKLKGINQSYAMFTRLQDAAVRSQGGGGVVTPGDLLAAVKKGDRTIRKGAFARGDALLQRFAEDADRVLSPKVRDSGTPERQATNRLLTGRGHIGAMLGGIGGAAHGGMEGGAIGAGIGAAADMVAARGTNALARRMLERGPPRAPSPNTLKSVNPRVVGRATAVPAISDQSQR